MTPKPRLIVRDDGSRGCDIVPVELETSLISLQGSMIMPVLE
jgi:hypothetical protein